MNDFENTVDYPQQAVCAKEQTGEGMEVAVASSRGRGPRLLLCR